MARCNHIITQLSLLFNRISKKPDSGNDSGTSLVEVIIGMVILAMLVAGLNAGVLSLVNTNKASKEISAASNFGYEKLEEIRRDDYNNLDTRSNIKEGLYEYDVLVTSDIGNTQKSVKINIMWPSTSVNPKHQISLSTIIAKP
ncbi:MAG TPA: prepilin-type N-terminal cleavage/methylation domain-containing protein [Chitinispirillaceae bacterium]|nr:prepilin-type N-terminal cleavage/methylation domain-containing protein [Chitinispirillaceae bacterium]